MRHVHRLLKQSMNIILGYSLCFNSIRQTGRSIKEVRGLKLILRQLTRNEDDLIYIVINEMYLISMEE